MEIEEALKRVKETQRIFFNDEVDFTAHDYDGEAVDKLIEVAEQVERVKGITNLPYQKDCIQPTCKCPDCAIVDTHNRLNTRWRALIVGVSERLIPILKMSETDDENPPYRALPVGHEKWFERKAETIRNLFLGEKG